MTMTENPFILRGYDCVDFKETEDEIAVRLRLPAPTACEHCGTVGQLVKNGSRDMEITDLPVHDKPVSIWIDRQRFKCRACGCTFRQTLPELSNHYQMTERLERHVRREVFNMTHQALADRLNLSDRTIRDIFNDELKRRNKAYVPEAPRYIGIDELYLGGKYRCVITNLEERTFVDMLEFRNKPDVMAYLQKLPNAKDIEIASMDMWGPYRQAFRAVLPDVVIVVDKFHVTRMANEALENVRKALRSELTKKEVRALKGDRKVLLKRKADLSPQEILLMSGWVNNFEPLKTAYELKEGFFKIWDESESATEAEERLTAWRASIPEAQEEYWSDLVKASKNWQTEILAYFQYGKFITNATTESLNRKIRDLNRNGRGYSFEALRGMMLFAHPHKTAVLCGRKSPFMKDFIGMGIPRIVDYGVDLSTSG